MWQRSVLQLCSVMFVTQSVSAQLYAWGIQQFSPEQAIIAVVNGTSSTPSALINVPSTDNQCNVAFNPNSKQFYVPFNTGTGGFQAILSIDADTGNIISNATMTKAVPQTIGTLAFDVRSGLLYATSSAEQGYQFAEILAINPTTGDTTVVGNFTAGYIAPCYSAFVPASANFTEGVFLFTTSDLWVDNGFAIQAFDVATSTIVNTANTSRGINSVSTWDLDGPHATTALVMSYYGSTPMQLLAMDWLTGKTTKLMELKDETYSGDPSVQVYDPTTGQLYVILPHGEATALLAINTTAKPVTYEEYAVDAGAWAAQGVWALGWAF